MSLFLYALGPLILGTVHFVIAILKIRAGDNAERRHHSTLMALWLAAPFIIATPAR